jgi:hypothetical protein
MLFLHFNDPSPTYFAIRALKFGKSTTTASPPVAFAVVSGFWTFSGLEVLIPQKLPTVVMEDSSRNLCSNEPLESK